MMQVANKASRLHPNRVLFCRPHPTKPGELNVGDFTELFFETENLGEEVLLCPGKLALTLERAFNSPPGGNISISKVVFTSLVMRACFASENVVDDRSSSSRKSVASKFPSIQSKVVSFLDTTSLTIRRKFYLAKNFFSNTWAPKYECDPSGIKLFFSSKITITQPRKIDRSYKFINLAPSIIYAFFIASRDGWIVFTDKKCSKNKRYRINNVAHPLYTDTVHRAQFSGDFLKPVFDQLLLCGPTYFGIAILCTNERIKVGIIISVNTVEYKCDILMYSQIPTIS
ncbi:hypothetical protein CLF_108695 [Clonorchis sinensis]|uniref:Uncharacterized protein n=1 Tax=Clonorchis sinensis TaxID=79923 RepID=G7YRU6_CLOSI|nr:hypothetical protein CLF_108695 [Clonorchis sinensis]